MRSPSKLHLSVALTLGVAASASALTIDFDGLSGGWLGYGEVVTNQYQALGVTFLDSYSGNAHAESTLGAYVPGSSRPNVLWVDQAGGSTTGQYLEITFVGPVNSVETLFGTSLAADFTMEAYSGAAVVDSTTLIGPNVMSDVRSGQASVNGSSITSVRMYSHYGATTSFNFHIDNLTILPLPEPASLLMLAGLAGGAAARRRKHVGR